MEDQLMTNIFTDQKIQDEFEEKGYIKIPLLGEKELDILKEFVAQHLQSSRPVISFAEKLSYYISIFDKDPAHKLLVDELITKLITPKLRTILEAYECFYSNFMIKYPGDGYLECHQDFNLVDEHKYTAFNLWCPLIDTHAGNGGLSFIPGSHRIQNLYRGPNMPFSFTTYNSRLIKKSEPVAAKAGECLIFDHRTIHFSPPNKSNETRYAIQSVLKPREAEPLLYFYDAQNSMAVAKKMTKEFTINSGFWSPDLDQLPTLHTRPYSNPEELREVKNLIQESAYEQDI